MLQFWTSEMEKQVGERLQILLGDDMLVSAWRKFGGEAFRRSSVFHGLGKFLAEQNVRGARCFEIGTWNGLTAAVLSKHFDEVVSVDIAHNPLKHQLLDHLQIHNVQCINIGNNRHKAEIAAALEFDFAYLDGNHADDTEADWKITNHCGRVLFHEVWPFQEPVWYLVNSLPPEEVVYGGAGLALWSARA